MTITSQGSFDGLLARSLVCPPSTMAAWTARSRTTCTRQARTRPWQRSALSSRSNHRQQWLCSGKHDLSDIIGQLFPDGVTSITQHGAYSYSYNRIPGADFTAPNWSLLKGVYTQF